MVLGVIVGFMFVVELVGMIIIYLVLVELWVGDGDWLFFLFFYVVLVFCNVGFLFVGVGLVDLCLYVNWVFLSVIMVLVVIGGIGFLVMKNVWVFVKVLVVWWVGLCMVMLLWLIVGSCIVLVMMVVFFVGGMVVFYLMEYVVGG